MSFAAIDPVLDEWSKENRLQLFTSYQDEAVRTVFLDGMAGERSQIWLDPVAADGTFNVHVAVYRKRGRDNEQAERSATAENLVNVLDEALSLARDWLKQGP
jgi:hypothetical protein